MVEAVDDVTRAAVDVVLRELRSLASELSSPERAVLGAMLAPGISAVLEADAEVSGFGLVDWDPDVLPRRLAEIVQGRSLDLRSD